MSIPAFGWALKQGVEHGLHAADRLVLLFLADQAHAVNGEMWCWPGQPLIEKHTGLAENTVRAAVRRLTDAQLISVVIAPGKVTRYRLLTPANGNGATPSNGTAGPPQTKRHHPRKRLPQPPNGLGLTPSNQMPDPSSPKNLNLKTRDPSREASKEDPKIREKQEGYEPEVVPKAPTIGNTTNTGGRSYRQPGAPMPVADPNAEDPLDRPVDPQAFQALVQELSGAWQNNYPPREPEMSRSDMIDAALGKRRPTPKHLPEPVLRLARLGISDA